MTFQEIKDSDKLMLTPADIAPVLQCDPNVIRRQAAEDITKLGFSASKVGSRVKIPRLAFVAWMEGRAIDE